MVFGRVTEEMPAYQLLKEAPGFQVRAYAALVVAETHVSGVMDDGRSDAFKRLARYIGVFGEANNRGGHASSASLTGEPEKIAMTAPVLMRPEVIAMTAPVLMQAGDAHGAAAASQTMSFVLPASKYKCAAECPVPTDDSVAIKDVSACTWAVRTFSWNMKDASCRENLELLLGDLQHEKDWVVVTDSTGKPSWRAAGYNPPFALPWCKTNEVMVDIVPRSKQ